MRFSFPWWGSPPPPPRPPPNPVIAWLWSLISDTPPPPLPPPPPEPLVGWHWALLLYAVALLLSALLGQKERVLLVTIRRCALCRLQCVRLLSRFNCFRSLFPLAPLPRQPNVGAYMGGTRSSIPAGHFIGRKARTKETFDAAVQLVRAASRGQPTAMCSTASSKTTLPAASASNRTSTASCWTAAVGPGGNWWSRDRCRGQKLLSFHVSLNGVSAVAPAAPAAAGWHCRIADARAHSSILVAVWLAMTAQAIPAEQRHRLLLLPSGNCFVGDFNAEFKAHGRGTEFRPNGSEAASGQWRDGRLHGCGKQNNPEASRSEGNFVDGHYSGVGTFTWLQGTVYEGDLAEGKRSGLGMLWSRDGALLLCGRWEDDRLVEERPVPRNKISIGTHLSAAGTSSTARQARQQQSAAQQR